MRILAEDTVLLIIDIQERLFNFISDKESINSKLPKLINGIKILNLPILITEQYPKGLGLTVESARIPLGDDYKPIIKSEFSCVDCRDFMSQLAELGKKNVLIAGIESHVCVLQTVVDLKSNGYIPIVVADCVGSRSTYDKKIALKRMQSCGALLTTFESILFELLRDSAHIDFRKISAIVK